MTPWQRNIMLQYDFNGILVELENENRTKTANTE